MAWIAMQSNDVSFPAVAGQDLTEGQAVSLSASGVRNDLPVAMLASSGSRNLFVAICPPDQYPRPTPRGLYTAPWFQQIDPRDATEFLVDSGQRGPYYLVAPSLLTAPTVFSGWKVQAHRGGAYALTSACFVDSANIRNIGAAIEWNGTKFTYTTVGANKCGFVREYRDGILYIKLDDTSA